MYLEAVFFFLLWGLYSNLFMAKVSYPKETQKECCNCPIGVESAKVFDKWVKHFVMRQSGVWGMSCSSWLDWLSAAALWCCIFDVVLQRLWPAATNLFPVNSCVLPLRYWSLWQRCWNWVCTSSAITDESSCETQLYMAAQKMLNNEWTPGIVCNTVIVFQTESTYWSYFFQWKSGMVFSTRLEKRCSRGGSAGIWSQANWLHVATEIAVSTLCCFTPVLNNFSLTVPDATMQLRTKQAWKNEHYFSSRVIG